MNHRSSGASHLEDGDSCDDFQSPSSKRGGRAFSQGSTLADGFGSSDEIEALPVDRCRRSTHALRRSSTMSRMLNVQSEDGFSPLAAEGGRMVSHGTLADEFPSDEDEEEEDEEEEEEEEEEEDGGWAESDVQQAQEGHYTIDRRERDAPPRLMDPVQAGGARDSGVDMSYHAKDTPGSSPSFCFVDKLRQPLYGASPSSTRNFSRPTPHSSSRFRIREDTDFSMELDQALKDVALLVSTPTTHLTDATRKTITALRDITSAGSGTVEAGVQRLATSTTSVASHLSVAGKTLAISTAASSCPSPTQWSHIGFRPTMVVPPEDADDVLELLSSLHAALPRHDPAISRELSRLGGDTSELRGVLAGLLDSLQEERQAAVQAARVMRGTEGLVAQLREEYERAELGRAWLERERGQGRGGARRCAEECGDVVGGFEGVCAGLRARLEQGVAGGHSRR